MTRHAMRVGMRVQLALYAALRVSRIALPAAMLTVAALAPQAAAQWQGLLSLQGGYATNAFGVAGGDPASMSSLGLALGYMPEGASWYAMYSGSLAVIPHYADQQYSLHGLSFNWELPGESSDRLRASASAGVSARFGAASIAAYDYSQGAASGTAKVALSDALSLRAEYRFRIRAYQHSSVYGFLEHAPSIGASLMLPTNTSLHVDASYGGKRFPWSGPAAAAGTQSLAGGIDGNLEAQSAEAGGGGEPSAVDGAAGNGNGDGNGNGNGSGGNGGGYGKGMHSSGSAEYPVLTFDVSALTQAGLRVSVGQSLGEGLGLGLKYQRRWNLDGNFRALVSGMLTAGGDDELLDDPYSYSSNEGSATLTALLPWGVTATPSVFAQWKSYPYPASLDASAAGPLRSDRRFGASLGVEKSIDGAWLLFSAPVVTLEYSYVRNQSNTTVFDYATHGVALGLEVGL
jgi:hypothetical protein